MTAAEIDLHARELFDVSPHPMLIYNRDSLEIVHVNRAAADEYGYSREQFTRLRMTDIRPPEAVPAFRRALERTGVIYCGVWTHRRRDGSTFSAEISANDLPDGNGPLRMVLIQRVGEFRSAELDEQRRLQRLAEQQRAINELATSPAFTQGDLDEAVMLALRTGSEALQTRRLSFWRMEHEPRGLRCVACYDADHGVQEDERFIAADAFPDYLQAIHGSRALAVGDATTDVRIEALRAAGLRAADCSAALDTTVRLRGKVCGVLCHDHVGGARHWLDDETRFTTELADQVSQVMLNAERNRYVDLLHDVAAGVARATGRAFFRTLVRQLGLTLGACHVHAAQLLPDGNRVRMLAAWRRDEAISPTVYALAGTACEEVMHNGVRIYPRGLMNRFPDDPHLRELGVEGYIGVRLHDSENRPSGLLIALFDTPIELPAETLALVRIFAARAGSELERLTAERHIRRAAAVFSNTVEGIVIAASHGGVIETNPAFLEMTGHAGGSLAGEPLLEVIGIGRGEIGRRVRQRLEREGRWDGEIECPRADGTRFPVWASLSRFAMPDPDDLQFVALISDITQIRESQVELEYLAHHDPLTGLPNRARFRERLDTALDRAHARDTRLGVLFIDLDGFKDVNDSLGHDEGDRLLVDVARRLSERTRAEDSLGRVGGDEFMLLVRDLAGPDDAARAASRLLEAFTEPFDAAGHRVFITASVGIALYPGDGADADALIRAADSAMYRAKAEGRDTYWFYTQDLTTQAYERISMVGALRTALARQELSLAYQPVFDLRSGEVIACEALLRWQPAHGAPISPAEFIPTAEASGMIVPISRWVFGEACRQMRQWLDAGEGPRRIAINVSPAHLHRADLVSDLLSAAAEHGVEPCHLMIEVTESLLMQGSARGAEALAELRARGVEVAIDDFGTGYSSLSYLKQLPISVLKLDKSFTRDLPDDADDAAISRAIIALARSLALHVVAEGIESPQQLAYLQAEGCYFGQGFYLGRPTTPQRLTAQLRQPPGWAAAVSTDVGRHTADDRP
jgi:diguanylate cyclase (GGDEF)-like protein/PAS domain S-box-containing protein